MAALVAACKERGLLPFVNYNRLHVVPPCTITDEEAKEGLRSSTTRSPWPTDTPPADHPLRSPR